MDRKLGIESNAITRKRASDRPPLKWHQQLNMTLMWWGSTLTLSCFATGFLGHEFGLDLRQTVIVAIFVCVLGAFLVGMCAVLGQGTGLRQISVGRYSFVWWPNKVIAVLNVIEQVGYVAVGCITGGSALQAVADGHISIVVGIVINAVVSLVVSLAGLKAVLLWERYVWMLIVVLFFVIYGMTGKYADNTSSTSGTAETASGVLNWIAVVYGSTASWAPCASDYYTHYPVTILKWRVVALTTVGIALPTSFGLICGAVVASALDDKPEWSSAYDTGIGYLIRQVIHPRDFAKVVLTLLVFSGINNNIVSFYSASLSLQQLGRPLARIPRFLWTLLCFLATILLAILGREHLNEYLSNFLALLGYWCTSYILILLIEHYHFRGGNFKNYDLEGWNDPERLPHGLAAAFASLLGVIAWCMGMVETWFVGPLGGLIGTDGGDVAIELTAVVTALAYVPARCLELRYFDK